MSIIFRAVETVWVCSHGAPSAFSADDEYNRAPIRTYPSEHDMFFKPSPWCGHNKILIVERKNRTVKIILAKHNDESTIANPEQIVASAAFLSNMFSGNLILSSSELAKEYISSTMVITCTVVTQELLQAYNEQIAMRTLQRLMLSRASYVLQRAMFKSGDTVWVFYYSTKRNEKV